MLTGLHTGLASIEALRSAVSHEPQNIIAHPSILVDREGNIVTDFDPDRSWPEGRGFAGLWSELRQIETCLELGFYKREQLKILEERAQFLLSRQRVSVH